MCIQTLQETLRESNQKQVTSTKKNISTPIDKKTISKYSVKNPKTINILNAVRRKTCQKRETVNIFHYVIKKQIKLNKLILRIVIHTIIEEVS